MSVPTPMGTGVRRVHRNAPLVGVLTTVVGLVVVAVIVAAVGFVPDHERRSGPLVTRGEVGSPVDTGGFVLDVSRVRVTRELTSSPDELVPEPPIRTDGLWVVVDATLTGDWKAAGYADARLEQPDGTTYAASERLGSAELLTSDYRTEPGLPRRGLIVFEVPSNALTGNVLKLRRSGVGEGRLPPEAEVDLGLDEEGIARVKDKSPNRIPLESVEFA